MPFEGFAYDVPVVWPVRREFGQAVHTERNMTSLVAPDEAKALLQPRKPAARRQTVVRPDVTGARKHRLDHTHVMGDALDENGTQPFGIVLATHPVGHVVEVVHQHGLRCCRHVAIRGVAPITDHVREIPVKKLEVLCFLVDLRRQEHFLVDPQVPARDGGEERCQRHRHRLLALVEQRAQMVDLLGVLLDRVVPPDVLPLRAVRGEIDRRRVPGKALGVGVQIEILAARLQWGDRHGTKGQWLSTNRVGTRCAQATIALAALAWRRRVVSFPVKVTRRLVTATNGSSSPSTISFQVA